MNGLDYFSKPNPVIGMVHLLALPGSPGYSGDLDKLFEQAENEANILAKAGIDGLIIENYNDEPFLLGELPIEQISIMTAISTLIREQVTIPIGINVHFNDWKAEIAIAKACKAQFARIEVFVDTVVTAAGIVQPCAPEVTRYRKEIGAESVAIWADLHPKFSKNLYPVSLEESARMADTSLADALIVTGTATGVATPIEDVATVKEITSLPVLVGSGTTKENVEDVFTIADGAIVGSALKEGGDVYNKVSQKAVRDFIAATHR